MASSINIPSYIMHHVFGFFSLATQLRKLALVCKSWHHTSLCMNCITTNSTPEEVKVWFKHYFDIEVADLLTRDYRAILGAPYSYVVRNLVFYTLRAIQEAVPHLEAEIFESHERLANASDRSERIVLLYQWSSLLYLLKKLESMFDIYESFVDINTTVGKITLSVCRRDNLKLFAHFGALIKFRFDGNPEHRYNNDFHVLAAIKCFDFKLLIKKSTQWLPAYKLIEATIGTKFLEPKLVYQHFEQKFVDICKQDFDDFNEILSVLEGSLVITQDTEDDSNSLLDDTVSSPRATQTLFPIISDEQLNQYMQLAPTVTCDRQHPLKLEPFSPTCYTDDDHDHCNTNNNNNDETYQLASSTTTTCATTPRTPKKSIPQTCNSETNNTNTNNTTSNNAPSINDANNKTDTISHNNDNNQSKNTNAQDQQQEQEGSTNVANIRCEDESARFMSGILEVSSESSTDSDYKLMRVSSQTTNDSSTNDSSTNDEFPATLPLSARSSESAVLVKRTFHDSCSSSEVVEDYKYFFDSEENSFEDDDVGGDFECEDDDDFDDESEYGFDDEKENEPPTKFRRKLAEPSV